MSEEDLKRRETFQELSRRLDILEQRQSKRERDEVVYRIEMLEARRLKG